MHNVQLLLYDRKHLLYILGHFLDILCLVVATLEQVGKLLFCLIRSG